MRFAVVSSLVVGLAAQQVVGTNWFSKAAYNKWHQTELERWLSDHDIPYPSPADRKDLEDLLKNNWDDNVVSPYRNWDADKLQAYLKSRGHDVADTTQKNKDSLVQQVKQYWHETADQASDSYGSVRDWIFDSWTDSQLKAFLDYHQIPNPTPRTRDSLLQTARANYQKAAEKVGETASYPGDWLYQQFSDSDLKAWLDERGVPVPQSSSRDKLIASIRRNSRLASDRAASAKSSLTSSASGAQQTLSDKLLASWSDSNVRQWCEDNGIKLPQGSNRKEMEAVVRRHYSKLSSGDYTSSAASAYGAATSSASNEYAKATNGLFGTVNEWYSWALGQVGIGGSPAERAKSSALSASHVASVKAASASQAASRSAKSVASGYGAADKVEEAYQEATNRVKEEL